MDKEWIVGTTKIKRQIYEIEADAFLVVGVRRRRRSEGETIETESWR